jgi:hypothetical protein
VQVQAHSFHTPFARPVQAAPLDQVMIDSVQRMEADLGPEVALRARTDWEKKLAKNQSTEMTPVWMAGNWLSELEPDQMAAQDHTSYVLPFLRETTHPAAPAMVEVVDRFLPTLTSARDRNHLVESAARALRRSTEREARFAFGMFCGALTDGGLAVRRHLAEETIAKDPQFTDLMQFGLEVASRLDDGTRLGQHQASRALYSSFFATKATATPAEELKVTAAGIQSHAGNTLWQENEFRNRFPDTVALITDPSLQVKVAQVNLDVLGDPLFAQTDDPVGMLRKIGILWPERKKWKAEQSTGIRMQGDHLLVGGVALRTKA